MKRTKKLLSVLLALVMLLSFGTLAFAEGETPNYHWQPIPTSTAGLNVGDPYVDLSVYFSMMIMSGTDPAQAAATQTALESGTWSADHDLKALQVTVTLPGEAEQTVIMGEETYDLIVKAYGANDNYNWAPLPLSADGLQSGDYYLDLEGYAQINSNMAEHLSTLRAMTYYIDVDAGMIRMVGSFEGYALDTICNEFFLAVREVDPHWYPVHFYTDDLNDGDWYMDFDEQLAEMLEQGIYTYYDTDGPHIRAMYERLGYENSFYINPTSKLCKYAIYSAGPGNEPDETWSSLVIHPLMDFVGTVPDRMKQTRHFDRVIKQYHPADFVFNGTPIPTSPEGLADGEFYLDFSFRTESSRPENKADAEAMYANGTWLIDTNQMLLKGEIDIPASIYPSDNGTPRSYHMRYDASPFTLSFALREAGVDWLPVATSTEGLQDGDWYLDKEAFVDGYAAYKANRLNNDSNPLNDTTAAQVRADIVTQGVDSWIASFFPNDLEIYKGNTAQLYRFVVPTPSQGYIYPTETVYVATADSDFYAVFAASVKQYSAPAPQEEEHWVVLPYTADGLNEGDWYLDTTTFMNLIGEGKTAEEKAAVLETIKQHVTFFYNPDGIQLVYKYIYTDLPDENGNNSSDTVILPYDLTTGSADAFPFDYSALQQSVKQYTAPTTPDDPGNNTPDEPQSGLQRFVAQLRSFIQSILSFFRRLFKII